MIPFVYITSSSFSGSTLLSFLLNTHPDIVTLGEAEGWNYGPDESFPCSCGASLSDCPFFRRVAMAFENEDLPFDPRDFGTRYRLTKGERLNRYLTADLPRIGSTILENLRDRLVASVPAFAARLARQDRANLVFARTALAVRQARVFVDTSKSPYRLRHLRRIRELDIHVLHMSRDPRGVILSNMKKKGYDAALAIRLWIDEQVAICRVMQEFTQHMTIYYEDLCDAVDDALARIHAFVGVPPEPAPEDFKSVQHHILGNEMRLSGASTIRNDLRWMRELSAADVETIARACAAFRQRHANHPVAEIIARYGCDVPHARGSAPEPARSPASAQPTPDATVPQHPTRSA